jgi:hypothetical protein
MTTARCRRRDGRDVVHQDIDTAGRAEDLFDAECRGFLEAAATNHAVKVAAGVLNADVDDSADVQRAHGAFQSLIDAARADREVRADLSIDDFYLLVSNAPADQSPAVLERWVDLILFGITGSVSR